MIFPLVNPAVRFIVMVELAALPAVAVGTLPEAIVIPEPVVGRMLLVEVIAAVALVLTVNATRPFWAPEP